MVEAESEEAQAIPVWLKNSGVISLVADFVPIWQVRAALKALPYATSAINNFSGRYLSVKGGLIMTLYDWFVNFTVDLGALGASMGNVFWKYYLTLALAKYLKCLLKTVLKIMLIIGICGIKGEFI